ncbi:MAG TPA: hypothetical protein V6D12_25215 [Candidatus Obscuribacterales bacterium]
MQRLVSHLDREEKGDSNLCDRFRAWGTIPCIFPSANPLPSGMGTIPNQNSHSDTLPPIF